MASTFLDLFVAKVVIQLGLLDPPGACAALRAVDLTPGGLLDHLATRLAVDPARVRTIERHARRCLFLKGEALYLRFLRERGWVDDERLKPLLWQVRAHPPDGRDLRLGALLVQQGLIAPEQDQAVAAQAEEALERDNEAVTARYRERGYVGIEQNSQSVAEVIAAEAAAPARAPVAPAPEPVGVRTQILAADVAAGLRPISSDRQPALARPAAAGSPELMGDLGLSRDAGAPPVVVATEEHTTELKVLPEHRLDDTAKFPAPELARTGLDEKYRVVRKLGEGGMGAVYLAYALDDPAQERPMALKVVLDVAKSKDAAARFKREILATSMCAHENIIEIYDAAETADGSFYMAMEYLAGEQLDEVLKREGPLSIPRVVDLVEQALEGLEAVHRANIVHRDIKPQNFRIWRDPAGRERLKLMDFGIARVLDAEETGAGDQFFTTMAGKITGSPAYIAPECIVNESLDGRADLYSLGVAIFRIATGRLPFVARTPDEYLPMHLYKKPPLLRELLPDAPPELESFAARLLEKAPGKRFPDAGEAVVALREQVRPALLRDGFVDAPAGQPAAAATSAERTPGGVETTAQDRGAVPFTPAPGPSEQVRLGGDLAPTRDALPHEVAETVAMGPEEAAAAAAEVQAAAAASSPMQVPAVTFAETQEAEERSPVADAPAPAGKGKLLVAVALALLLLAGLGAAGVAVLLRQG
ncbi:MAG: serine/threonine protein kinase [Planctomycetes bacterium]|nr:serine/threonine protein kinase [Planctomycetota bacterium]